GTVRAAAFMGYRMIAAAEGLPARPLGTGHVAIDDPRVKGYLANVPADDWRSRHRAQIPEQLLGSEFLGQFGGTTDPNTTIDPTRRYPVRAATEHAIEEHQLVTEFRAPLPAQQ